MRASPSILLIETSSLMRRTIQEILEEEGYVVTGAAEAPDALLAVRQVAYDVIIADMVQPEFSDPVIEQILANALGNPATIIMREPTLQIRDAPPRPTVQADIELEKPFAPDDLRTHVRNVLFRRISLGRSSGPSARADKDSDLPQL